MILDLTLHSSWQKHLKDEFQKDYFIKLDQFLSQEEKLGKNIFPKTQNIFSAFNQTHFEDVRVVIIGQDPYHGKDQAHGLSFSVNPGIKIPPSLVNIYKELKSDLDIETPDHGHLMSWAKSGVLLLNNVLTVEESRAASHQKKGWEEFTDKVIDVLSREKEGLVFILWGAPAQKKASRVDEKRHFLIKSVHPSPLSSYRGFFGSKPFSKANNYLVESHQRPIDWQL